VRFRCGNRDSASGSPPPVPEDTRKPKPCYAPGSLEWEEEQRRLIGLGWLTTEHARDVNAIGTAFRRFAGRALSVAQQGAVDLWNVQGR